jgi:hypothetical protein
MGEHTAGKASTEIDQTVQYQLEFLKLEFESVNHTIRRIDETTQDPMGASKI